jgi:hypothetical protein
MSAANALNAFMTTRQFRQGEEDRAMALEDRQRAIGLENTRGKINALMMQPGEGANRATGMDAGFTQGQSAPQPSRMDQARQMAVQSGSSELMGQFQQQLASMDAATREQNAAMFGLVGQVANSLRGVPVTQRGTALMAMAPQLQAAGVPDQEIQNYAQILSDPQSSDAVLEALSSRVLEAQSVFDAYAPQMQGENEVLSRFQNGQQVQGAVNPNAPVNQATERMNAETARMRAAQPRGPLVNVNTGNPQLDPFQSQLAEAEGEVFASFFEAGTQAQRNLAQINRLDHLMSNTETGGMAAVQMMLGNLGIETEGLSDIQAFESLVSAMAPNQRPPGSGPMSDADLQLFLRSLPRLINTPEGNRTIIETLRGIAEYDIQLGNIAARASSGEIARDQARQEVNSLSNPLARFGSQRMRFDPESGRLVPME